MRAPRHRRAGVAALAAALLALALPAVAAAHGLVGRADLPIPAYLFGWAAAIVLVVSFLGLAVLWPQPRLQQPRERRLFDLPRWVEPICGAIGVAVFVLVVYAGFAGVADENLNFAPTIVYVIFWVGFPLASVLFGDVFRAFSPWRALARSTAWIAGRVRPRGLPAPIAYPARLGCWPAVASVLAFAWLELACHARGRPSLLAALSLAYAVIQLVGMSAFGIEEWSRRGDGFGVLFGLYARLAPLTRRGRAVYARPPLGGSPGLDIMPGTVALLAVAIGSTTFDGFSAGSIWNTSLLGTFSGWFRDLGAGDALAAQWAATLGLAACVLLVAAFYVLGIRGVRTVDESRSGPDLRARFAHTLIPIAFAYTLAHYFSLLAFKGQQVAYLVSDPLGHGSDLFGTAHASPDYFIGAVGIWYIQVGALILGHVAGLVLAHDRALAMYTNARDAVRSQGWMLVVMVGFTSLGLWLLSAVSTSTVG